jgi:hypothetical protein
VSSQATLSNLLGNNYASGGDRKSMLGNICGLTGSATEDQCNRHHSRQSSEYPLAMADLYAVITVIPARSKALCIRVGDVARLWFVRWPSLNQ